MQGIFRVSSGPKFPFYSIWSHSSKTNFQKVIRIGIFMVHLREWIHFQEGNSLASFLKRSLLIELNFYGPVNLLGSCLARSFYLTTLFLDRLSPLTCEHSFARNWQQPFLNQQNEHRKYFMFNLLERMLLDPAGILFISPIHIRLIHQGRPKKGQLKSFWQRVFSKRKEIAPKGSKFFPLRVDPFSEEAWCAWKQRGSHKSWLPY